MNVRAVHGGRPGPEIGREIEPEQTAENVILGWDFSHGKEMWLFQKSRGGGDNAHWVLQMHAT